MRGWLDRFQRIEQRLRFLVLDVDQLDRFFGDRLALRRYRGDFFADKPDHAIGENRHVVNFSADQKTFDVCAGNNGMHAR